MPSVYSNTSGNSRNLRAGTGGFLLLLTTFFSLFVKLVAVIVIEIIVASVVV